MWGRSMPGCTMTPIESLKAVEDGLLVKDRIAQYAQTGWESIPADDIQRLKWHGIFLRNPTPGFFMMRLRIPGGQTTTTQVRTIASLATRYGNGILDVTTRQQIQLRQLTIGDIPAILDALDAVGLSSIQTGMDNVRNVMTCPVAGLAPGTPLDASALVRQLSATVLNTPAYSNLPRKINIVITGCLDNCVHAETQDIALIPAQVGEMLGYNVLVGGKLGSGGYHLARPLDVFVREPEVVEVCRAILDLYRDHGPRESRTQARLAFLIEEWGMPTFRDRIVHQVGHPLMTAGVDLRRPMESTHLGIFRQVQSGLNYAGLKIVVGRMSAKDLEALCDLTDQYGTGDLRFTPAQALIIPNIPDRKIGDFSEEPLIQTFTFNPSPLAQGLVSCVGSDYCNLAVIETKRQAVQVAQALDRLLPSTIKPLTMHWSGCPAACGNHLVADIGLLGKKIKVNGQVVEGVDIFVGGRSGPQAHLATKLLEDVPCTDLPRVLASLIPYHTREKMHRRRGKLS